MKTIKKLTAILLCLALVLALAACGSFEQRMVKAAGKMEKLKSYHVDMDMDLSLALSMMGQSMDMDMLIKTAMDLRNDPLQVRSSATLEIMGQSTEMLTYVFAGEKEGSYEVYASTDGGETWNSSTVDADELKKELSFDASALWSADYLRDAAKTFEEVGKEEVNGSQATRYDGQIQAEDVGEALANSGVFDTIAESLPVEVSEILDKFSGSIPVSIWLDDKSGRIVRYDMDMTEAFASVWDTLLAEVLSEAGGELGDLAELGVSIELKQLTMSAVLSDFDAVGEIVLPEAAKAA